MNENTDLPKTQEIPSPPQHKRQPMFCAPFSFNGRVRRTEFWLSCLIFWAWIIVPIFIIFIATESSSLPYYFADFIVMLIVGLFCMASGLLGWIIFLALLSFLTGELILSSLSIFSIIAIWIIALTDFWFLITQGCKRCHDCNHSGWFQIIPYYFFWMLFAPSIKGTNRFGEDPIA